MYIYATFLLYWLCIDKYFNCHLRKVWYHSFNNITWFVVWSCLYISFYILQFSTWKSIFFSPYISVFTDKWTIRHARPSIQRFWQDQLCWFLQVFSWRWVYLTLIEIYHEKNEKRIHVTYHHIQTFQLLSASLELSGSREPSYTPVPQKGLPVF